MNIDRTQLLYLQNILLKSKDFKSSQEKENFSIKPINYNQKIYNFTIEQRTEELKNMLFKNKQKVENVYTKAESAFEEGYIRKVEGLNLFKIAKDIQYFKDNIIEDTHLIRNIIINLELENHLDMLEEDILEFINLNNILI